MTEDQQRLADQLLAVLDQDSRIESVWLSGSLGRGAGDAWSDLDLTLTVAERDIPSCLADYSAPRAGLPPLAFSQALFGRVLTAITEDWARLILHSSPRRSSRGRMAPGFIVFAERSRSLRLMLVQTIDKPQRASRP